MRKGFDAAAFLRTFLPLRLSHPNMRSFHYLLRDFVNTGESLLPSGSLSAKCSALCLAFASESSVSAADVRTFRWPAYSGNDPSLVGLKQFLAPVTDDLVTVILHGSTGDGRTTTYSDVDALVIVRDEVFLDVRRLQNLGRQLSRARKFFYRYDPLQHHGWFILAEKDLRQFPEPVLPLEALQDASVLLGKDSLKIYYQPQDHAYYKLHALHLTDKLIRQLASGWRPSNVYQLKSLFSEFMMLPVLFQQAKEGRGCSKRDSFSTVAASFPASTWRIMNDISDIRSQWHYQPSSLNRWILTRTNAFFTLLRKRWPTAIPGTLKQRLTPSFYQDMLSLARAMKAALEF